LSSSQGALKGKQPQVSYSDLELNECIISRLLEARLLEKSGNNFRFRSGKQRT
jgi:hypothetical protein